MVLYFIPGIFLRPIYYPRTTLALPPTSSSNPVSHSGPSSPVPTTVRAFTFTARRIQHFLPSSTRANCMNSNKVDDTTQSNSGQQPYWVPNAPKVRVRTFPHGLYCHIVCVLFARMFIAVGTLLYLERVSLSRSLRPQSSSLVVGGYASDTG